MNALFGLLIMAGLIIVHETGHLMAGYILGIPRSRMAMQFLNRERKTGFLNKIIFYISPHIALLDEKDQKIAPSPNQMERYIELLESYLPSERKMFWYVGGGHAFEFVVIYSITILSFITKISFLNSLALHATQIALMLAAVYILLEFIAQLRSRELTGGDFTGLWTLSPIKTVIFYTFYFIGLMFSWYLVKP